MDKMYVIKTDTSTSKPMTRSEAINQVKEYDHKGISGYIVSEKEGERIKNSQFNIPKWK
ncbi:hypothetical protein [Marinisporobacter balticus]|uniref:Uncharacterized protein n=1 Tax=Marinisporobacter balticus TaxID=2018667 RepID=A0A4R2KP98_9FIRM|nr:hypothetical protein [Marinisporobacter balticus]TCO74572.1 hypothetical protein EV214_11250 [Marinisporobacter balticus]